MPRRQRIAIAIAMAFPACGPVHADHAAAPVKHLGVVTVTGSQPTSLPTQVPTTMEGISREQVEQTINATDSEDALKYLPSLLVRKRYVGDYNHAVLSSRASGTGNSARSAVYADGILLSNFLGNGVGGLSFPPRWGLVTPEEIERVDVMYGPFSAAYPGNSVGAVVDYVTRMPKKLEGHAKIGYVLQPFELYGTDETFRAYVASASLGSKSGDWSWWLNVNRIDSEGQPLTFATRPGTVAGGFPDRNPQGQPITVVAAGTQYHTVQDHVKAKLAYDFSPTLRASYVFGLWENTATNRPMPYVTTPLTGADLPHTDEKPTHFMHGLVLKQHTQGPWDWEIAASRYDYDKDLKRQNAGTNTLPMAATGGPGTIADGSGTGWTTLAARATWRPQGLRGAHIVDFGVQQDDYELAYRTSAIAGNWMADAPGAVTSDVGGRTRLRSLWVQDAWRVAPEWKAVLGLRHETWTSSDGLTRILTATPAVDQRWPRRSESHVSPKAALSWQWLPHTVAKASVGRAVRFPTVAELYGATNTANARFINDPNLKPERSWTGELSVERDLGNAIARITLFGEDTREALYSQTTFDPVANLNVSRVQNIGRIATKGLEAAFNGHDIVTKGLDFSASLTWAHSEIRENAGFVATPGDTIGKRQPNIPLVRAAALVAWRWSPEWSTSLGARYSSRQFRTLNNSDTNGFTYMGVSRFLVFDARAQWKVHHNLTAAFGIDNLGKDKYWNFHPYPQRSFVAELKADF